MIAIVKIETYVDKFTDELWCTVTNKHRQRFVMKVTEELQKKLMGRLKVYFYAKFETESNKFLLGAETQVQQW